MNSNVDTRPYTAVELHALRTNNIPHRIACIRREVDAGDVVRAQIQAGYALQDAAYFLQRGAVDEAHQLITAAAAAIEKETP